VDFCAEVLVRLALTALLLMAPALASAQDEAPVQPPTELAEIERAVRRRFDAWARERAPDRLVCKGCSGIIQIARPCRLCGGKGITAAKLEAAFWRYLRPSYRRGRDAAVGLRGLEENGAYLWGGAPAVAVRFEIESLSISRDAVWVYFTCRDRDEQRSFRCFDIWVWEAGNFHIEVRGDEPGPLLVQHPWFIAGTFSVSTLTSEVARIEAQTRHDPSATNLEQERRGARAAEQRANLRERSLVDVGVIANVTRADGALYVIVRVGPTHAWVRVKPEESEGADALEERLATLEKGTRVVFHLHVEEWTPINWTLERVSGAGVVEMPAAR